MNNKDALFRFALSEDGMKLGVSRYFPPNGGEGPSVALIKKQVAAAGVQLAVNEENAQKVVDAIKTGTACTGIALVYGTPPTEPRDAQLMALGDINFPVFPDDLFIRYREAVKAKPGTTIDGKTVKPKGTFTPEEIEVSPGENVVWNSAKEAYASTVWGMVRIQDGVISVDQLPRITEDEIMVTGTLHHRDFKGNDITPARVEKELRDLGVLIDIDLDAIDAKLAECREMEVPKLDEVLVMGAHPVPGRDGWFESLVATREETGTEDEAGRLNFRDRGTFPMVKPDQIIGRLHPPTPGEGGIDIYGKTIPAHSGKDLRIHVGEHVSQLEDKATFQSKTHGVVVMNKNTLSVTECLVINGDVNMASGNVKVEHGSVLIKGSINAGFEVESPEHVMVQGSIESATVKAGGLIEVSGGILMPDGGLLKAGGDVVASYATNARIKARGDVYIANETQNSAIETEGKFFGTSGKGMIQGGVIITAKGIEANEIGSELGVTTNVGILLEADDTTELQEERKKVVQAIKKVEDALGNESAEAVLARTPDEKKPAVAAVLKHRMSLIAKRKEISEQINKLIVKRQAELEGVTIAAKKFVHPGVRVRFGRQMQEIGKRLAAPTIYWHPGNREIALK